MSQGELFAAPEVERPYEELGRRLWDLARRGVYFGSSSWKYESWRGMVYCDDYRSKKDFESRCLQEYARVFPAVGGDFSFYTWPGAEMIERINAAVPRGFKIGLKATELVTIKRYPSIGRWGDKAGKLNPDFLNAKLFKTEFLDRVEVLGDKLAPIILEFTAFPRGSFTDWTEFATALETFFVEIRKVCGDRFEFGVELRTKDYITAGMFAALEAMNEHLRVAPIINSWTRTPPMDEQLKLFAGHDFPFLECRPVMKPGRTREEAVQLFEPYDRIRDPNPVARLALTRMAEWALNHARPCYVFINNHLEGCAHQTIAELAGGPLRPLINAS